VSLYRQPGRVASRTLALVGVLALVVGLAAGFGIGRASKSEPSLASRLSDLRTGLAPAREGLELVPTEYAQAVRGGRVASSSELGGARAAVTRAQTAIAASRDDLRALNAARAAALDRAVAALATAMAQHRDPAEVKRLADAAGAALSAAGGP
jgi:hypothetical protein